MHTRIGVRRGNARSGAQSERGLTQVDGLAGRRPAQVVTCCAGTGDVAHEHRVNDCRAPSEQPHRTGPAWCRGLRVAERRVGPGSVDKLKTGCAILHVCVPCSLLAARFAVRSGEGLCPTRLRHLTIG